MGDQPPSSLHPLDVVGYIAKNHFPPETLEGMRADRQYNEEARLSRKLRHYVISFPAQDKIPYP